MQKRRLTHRQKVFLASCGLKPENWYLEKETDKYYQIISENGQRRLIQKKN